MRKFAISKFKAFKQIPKPIACIMKLSVFLLLLSFQVYAEGSAQKVTLNFQNEKFGKILKSIEQQTSYRFVFSNHIVPVNKTLSIKAEQRIVQEVLKELLLNFSLDFREEGGNLIVIFQEAKHGEEQTTAPLADIEIRGKVSSAQGLALSGASIAVKGTNRGTSSNAEGNFSISVPNQSSVLLVSYVGHQTKEVRVGNSRNIEISLELSDATGNEIVVVGYGTQRRRDVTGAISKVNEEAFKLTPIASADQALQGRAAGVQVTQSSGAPGGAVQVRIRGVNTTAGNGANQPLYVVDGVPLFYNEGMNSLGIGNPGQSGGGSVKRI
jgi:type II secretory pathway component GspD/PulD (secretin)